MDCYLDNSATTKPCRACVEAVITAIENDWGNPSSLHRKGIDAFTLLESSRKAIAKSLSSDASEIYFTGSGTVSNNTAIFGAVNSLKRRGNKIVTTSVEHPSVQKCMDKLLKDGFEVVRIRPQQDGNIDVNDFTEAIDENTILVSLMSVNNEIGSVLPFGEIKKIIKQKKSPALLHVDNVQGYLKIPAVPKYNGIDLMSISAHKVHGIKGAGALYINKNVKISPFLFGGGQESGICPGTQGLPAIAGFSAAVEDFGSPDENFIKVQKLNLRFKELIKDLDGVILNSPDNAVPYIINISLEKIPSQVSVNYFSMNGVYVSAGSACSKGHRSNVLSSMELSPERIDSALRISLSHSTTEDEIDRCVEVIKSALLSLRKK